MAEGPAEIELKAIDRIACRSGKLRARVPPSARGFRVDSPAVDLVDLGTEFGMRVVPGQKSEVHVFDGKVELYETGSPSGRAAKWELSEGHGVRIGMAGEVTPLVSDPPAFLAPPELERLYLKESRDRYNEWLADSRSWCGDHRLLMYFSFEDDRHPGSRVLVNEGGDRSKDGSIVGCEWVDGRWPGKGALEFKRPSDRVRFLLPGEFESLTFATWVRIDAIEHRFSSLMLTDGFEPGEPHWQIDWLGRIVLGIRAEPERRTPGWFRNYTSPRVFTPERFGRWTHVATVYDGRTSTVTHYADGAEVGSETLERWRPLRIGDAELGNWGVPVAIDDWPIRNLCGRMDEFALFRTALGPDEIRALYERGSGTVKPRSAVSAGSKAKQSREQRRYSWSGLPGSFFLSTNRCKPTEFLPWDSQDDRCTCGADAYRAGFTLIELLVVIAIIAVLIASCSSRRAGGARGGAAHPVYQQHEANRPGLAQLLEHQRIRATGCPHREE